MWLVHLNFRKSNQQMGKSEHLPSTEGRAGRPGPQPEARRGRAAGHGWEANHRAGVRNHLRGSEQTASALEPGSGAGSWQVREGRCLRYQTGIKPNRPGFKPDGTPG